METLSCHSNQSACTTAIKNNILVEVIVRDNSVRFQLYPPNSFWGVDFIIFFTNFAFSLPWWPTKLRGYNKKDMFCTGPLKEHFCKTKYLQWDSSKCQFSFFAIATRVLIRLEQKTILFIPPAYRCYMWNMARIGFLASEEMPFENVDDDDEDHWSCIAHLSAEDMLKSAVTEENKFKHSPWARADNPLGPKF